MRGHLSLLLSVVCLAGAGAARAQTPANFVPLVPAADTIATCEISNGAELQPGEVGFRLRFPQHGADERVVSAVWDSSGHLRRYSDARGDLRGPPLTADERGARTTIVIDVVKGMALLINDEHGKTRGSAMTTAAAALSADRLGPPKRLLERLHEQCHSP